MKEPTQEDIDACIADTATHKEEVSTNLHVFVKELLDRADTHDDSKLQEPELTGYAQLGVSLSGLEYGSEEYRKNLAALKSTIDHHYANNRHHPEHWPNGINGMTLIDLLEMLADWKAATKRNKNGNLRKSIEINGTRFKMTAQLRQILENTVREHFQD